VADGQKATCYIVSFDTASEAARTKVAEAIKAYGTWAHITASTWAVVTPQTHKEIRDHLKAMLPEGSRLFVIRSGSIAAWNNVRCNNEWLKRYL